MNQNHETTKTSKKLNKKEMSVNYVYNSFDSIGNKNVRAYLGLVEKGQPKVYETPFAKGESTSDLLKAWKGKLVSIQDKWPSLYEFEEDLANKVGPMSVMEPLVERLPDVEAYYEGIHLPSRPIDIRAIRSTYDEWESLSGLRVRSQKRTVELMKKSTNSGSPFFVKRRNVIDKTIPCDIRTGHWGVEQYLHHQIQRHAPAVIGWRGQEGGPKEDDVKQRVVWMFPFAVNVCELQVYQPLIESAQKLRLVPAWVSMEEVDRRVTNLFDTKGKEDLIICTDFTKFDQHFNKDLQGASFQVLRKLLTNEPNSKWWLEDVFPAKYKIPIVLKPDLVWHGSHGMASGSGGTNVDETLAHRALQHEAALLNDAKLNPNSQCLGDDGIISYPGCSVEDVVRAYSSHGLEMNNDKQYASTQDCVYLRRWHHVNYRESGVCVGVYSTCRALGRMRYLERYMDPDVWSPEMVNLRYLSILENVNHHPLRNEFVTFCMQRDKYRLGIDLPGFFDKLDKHVNEAIDHMPDFMGYTKTLQGFKPSSINDWWIVKFLKSKA